MLQLGNVTIDCDQPERLAPFWVAALGYSVRRSSPYFVFLAPARERQPNLLLIKVPEPKAGKNRVHLDLYTEHREAEIARLVSLGATRAEDHDEHGLRWTVMYDPEGNEFCVGE